jgi:D-sedoheptulose 7-phosphate isomerase
VDDLNEIQTIKEELLQAATVLENFLKNSENLHKIQEAAKIISEALVKGRKVISCGNGGSHCDAMHFAEELSGRYRENRKALAAIAISDPSHISCTANDYGFEYVFSRFIEGLGNQGDVLLAISTSGNSRNIIKAIDSAREKNMKIIALTGKNGGKIADSTDVEIRVAHQGYADRVQEVHIKIIHIIILLVEKMITRYAV